MGVKFVGQFLVDRGKISRVQLLIAASYQKRHNLKFGERAKLMGFLTNEQIEKIHNEQRSIDLPFGEMAVRLGFLTENKFNRVLEEQKKNHVYLGQVLIEQNAITESELEKELEIFKKEQSVYEGQGYKIPEWVRYPNILNFTIDLTEKICLRMGDVQLKIGEFYKPDDLLLNSDSAIILVPISGEIKAWYLFIVPYDLATKMTCNIFHTSVSSDDKALIIDGMKELANIIMGNISAKSSEINCSLEIHPPDIIKADEINKKAGIIYSLYSTEEKIFTGLLWESYAL
ncbi:MAG: chemotaxis protein CheX [Nitrospirota bacterium]